MIGLSVGPDYLAVRIASLMVAAGPWRSAAPRVVGTIGIVPPRSSSEPPECAQHECRRAREAKFGGAEGQLQRPPQLLPALRARSGFIAEPFNDVEENRRQEDAEHRDPEHAAENGNAQGPPHFRAGALAGDQWNDAEDKRKRRHQDWPQTQLAGLQRRFMAWHAALVLALR